MNTLRTALFAAALSLLAACGAGVDADEQDLMLDEGQSELGAAAKFQTFVGKDGQHYFHLIAKNGEKVLSSEGYTSKTGANGGITTVKKNGVQESRYLLREASNGEWYFVLVGGNGAIIGVSELFVSKANAERSAGLVRSIIQTVVAKEPAPVNDARFLTFKGLDGKYYFHARAKNGEIVIQSQGYASSSGAKNGAASVNTNGANEARYTVLPAADGKFYFTLKAANGQVIGRGQMYDSKFNAERAVESCVELFTVTLPR